MRLRGRRRCRECDTAWSYFAAGEIRCPNCGSPRSRARDGSPVQHTDTAGSMDLAAVREAIDERPLAEAAAMAADLSRRYLVGRGFIDGGELQPLDDHYVHAAELRHVATALRTRLDPVGASAERYFLALLQDEPPRPAAVPQSLHRAHGMAAAAAVDAYSTDIRRWLRERPARQARGHGCLDRLRTHVRRLRALEGAVPPDDADHLLAAARTLGEALRRNEPAALDRTRRALDRLEP